MTRRPGLTQRVEAYFRANPDEELTFADGQIKFGAQRANWSMAIKILVADGVLESVPRTVRLRRLAHAQVMAAAKASPKAQTSFAPARLLP